MEKKLHVHNVFRITSVEKLSEDQKKKSEVSKHIRDELLYQEIVIPDKEIEVLDYFVNLGYFEKRLDKIYKISWYYDAHPYLPEVNLDGFLGLNSNTRYRFTHNYFDSRQYQNFIESANFFKNQISSGNHKHIQFNYDIDFSYDTTVYEIKDRYFDAIKIMPTTDDLDIMVTLTEPVIRTTIKSQKTEYKKNWRNIQDITKEIFLSGSSKIDPLIDTLDWKKKIHGYIMHENIPYQLLTEESINSEENKKELQTPNFFDTGVFDLNNLMSRIFEDCIADYMRAKDYFAKPRVKYGGKEIDIFAEKTMEKKRNIVICECKLRINDSPITEEELSEFNEKKNIVLEKETTSSEKIEFWLVTNTKTVENEAMEYANKNNIQIKHAKMPKKWRRRSDWKISVLE